MNDSFGARSALKVGGRSYEIFRLEALARAGIDISRLPYSLRILLEEKLLFQDRAYRDYAQAVRYRLVPGLY